MSSQSLELNKPEYKAGAETVPDSKEEPVDLGEAAETQADKLIAVGDLSGLIHDIVDQSPPEVTETSEGIMQVQSGSVEHGDAEVFKKDDTITMMQLTSRDGLVLLVRHPERDDAEVLVNGESISRADMPKLQEALSIIKDDIEASKMDENSELEDDNGANEADASINESDAEKSNLDPETKAKVRKYTEDFIRAYMGNPRIRNAMTEAGVDLESLSDRMKQGTIPSQETFQQMRMLAKELGPGSDVWNTMPGARSMLGDIANSNRRKLAEILGSL